MSITRIISGIFYILILNGHVSPGPGTTPNLKEILIGRCNEYVTLVNPGFRYKCEDVWREFEEAVIRKSPCNVKVKDYERMFQLMHQIPPCDKLLFWSKTRDLMQSYAAVTRSFWTLENTLVGFLFNELIWCSQKERGRGFDYQSCPEWSKCTTHPVYSLWKQASHNFAAAACGNVTVLLNGSHKNAFDRESMFGSVELDNLNPRMVSHVHIKVVPNLEGPYIESCSNGSIPELINILQTRGFRWSCSDSDVTLMLLQCMNNPKHSICRTASNRIEQKISPHL